MRQVAVFQAGVCNDTVRELTAFDIAAFAGVVRPQSHLVQLRTLDARGRSEILKRAGLDAGALNGRIGLPLLRSDSEVADGGPFGRWDARHDCGRYSTINALSNNYSKTIR
jgi:hypothetical protein